jgi:hypothetical protein
MRSATAHAGCNLTYIASHAALTIVLDGIVLLVHIQHWMLPRASIWPDATSPRSWSVRGKLTKYEVKRPSQKRGKASVENREPGCRTASSTVYCQNESSQKWPAEPCVETTYSSSSPVFSSAIFTPSYSYFFHLPKRCPDWLVVRASLSRFDYAYTA